MRYSGEIVAVEANARLQVIAGALAPPSGGSH
jgi:hypothetical protein